MWYDALYCNDPSTDNVFGREDLAARRNTALLVHLRQGGGLAEFTRRGHDESPQLMARLDRALGFHEDLA